MQAKTMNDFMDSLIVVSLEHASTVQPTKIGQVTKHSLAQGIHLLQPIANTTGPRKEDVRPVEPDPTLKTTSSTGPDVPSSAQISAT